MLVKLTPGVVRFQLMTRQTVFGDGSAKKRNTHHQFIKFHKTYCNKRILSLTHVLILGVLSNNRHAWLAREYTTS
jgi:hypothetical protein